MSLIEHAALFLVCAAGSYSLVSAYGRHAKKQRLAKRNDESFIRGGLAYAYYAQALYDVRYQAFELTEAMHQADWVDLPKDLSDLFRVLKSTLSHPNWNIPVSKTVQYEYSSDYLYQQVWDSAAAFSCLETVLECISQKSERFRPEAFHGLQLIQKLEDLRAKALKDLNIATQASEEFLRLTSHP